MQTVTRNNFTTVKTEGAILPADLLQRVANQKVEGLQPTDYHLAPGEKLGEAISRAWTRCQGVWETFNEQRRLLPDSDSGASLTRERWLLILFQELGYGRLPFQQRGLEIGEKYAVNSKQSSDSRLTPHASRYPISHLWQQTPIHLVSFRQDLDRRDPSIKRSPHSLMQEFLNRSDDYLWGFVSNGLTLQILRDNISLTRAAYVEFDLEKMMAEQVYADFSLLWLVCHQSRVEIRPPDEQSPEAERPGLQSPANCWLEKWSQQAVEQGTRALDALSRGVQDAITALGRGFLAHPGSENERLKQKLRTGGLSRHDYFRQLLRMVYRLIFLFVAEDRDLLLLPEADEQARYRYATYYSAGRLRHLAEARRGGPHPDLYRSLRQLFFLLRADQMPSVTGYPPLGLPALGSFLFSERSTPALDECDIANSDLLNAIRALTFTVEGQVTRPVDYKNLGAEELGSVYESLLELHPFLNIEVASFTLELAAGSERKMTGSYYTPTSLIISLLDSALEPVVADRLRAVRSGGSSRATADAIATSLEEAILDIKVVDPACGSGHFLIAAANRLAAHLARVRTGDDEPSPTARREALRDVVHHCIHGVDINEMAVELCKVGLWMETIDPGKPLGFLERNIQCGNSLIGATPALLRQGIPDNAFKPITGDDSDYCKEWKARNKEERKGQLSMRFGTEPWQGLDNLATKKAEQNQMSDETLADIWAQEIAHTQLIYSSEYEHERLQADTWCAAFVWRKTNRFDYPITEQTFRRIVDNQHNVEPWMSEEIERLRNKYQFFHWQLGFSDVFKKGGFDVVLGNPPWEKPTIIETEFFSTRDSEIASTTTKAHRKKLIKELKTDNPQLHEEWNNSQWKVDGFKKLVQVSNRFPLSSKGELNTYLPFTELGLQIISNRGACGMVLKSSIFTADASSALMSHFTKKKLLLSLYDFRNWENLFPAVGYHERFTLLTFKGDKSLNAPKYAFYCDRVDDLRGENKVFSISAEEISMLSPNTGKCPILPSRRDFQLISNAVTKFPVLVNDKSGLNPWPISYGSLFHMSGDSGYFKTKEQLEAEGFNAQHKARFAWEGSSGEQYVPFYEGKYIQIYDHRFSSFEGIPANKRFGRKPGTHTPRPEQKNDPDYGIEPRYWIPLKISKNAISGKLGNIDYYLGARRVTNVISNTRTTMSCIIPAYPANDMIISFGLDTESSDFSYAHMCAFAVSIFNSFPFDYLARLRVSENLLKGVLFELPVPTPKDINNFAWPGSVQTTLARKIIAYIVELTFTSWDLLPFAKDCGYHGPPFRWDEERRVLLRCELDAAYFHLYGIARDDVDYIMDTFPIVKRKDEAAHSEYRTKRLILEIYDEMAEATRTGQPYQTRLDPPPADPRSAHTWDETYLGPYLDPSSWWQEVEAIPVEKTVTEKQKVAYQPQAKTPHSVKEPAQAFHLTSPLPTSKEADKTPSVPAHASQQPLLAVMPAPSGPRSRRLKQAMSLGKESTPTATRELVAFLADEDSSIRWLAGSSLVQRANSDVVAAIASFLDGAEAGRVAVARPEIQRVLGLIAETAESEAVRQAAQSTMTKIGGV